jgi:hypothetical protein
MEREHRSFPRGQRRSQGDRRSPASSVCTSRKEYGLTADAKEVPVKNRTEETFRSQDGPTATHKGETLQPHFQALFSLRASCRPIPSPSGARLNHRRVLCGPLLKRTSRRKPRWRSLLSKGDGNGTAIIKKKAMKTKSHKTQSAPGLRVQSSNHQEAPAPVQTPAQTPERPKLPPINFARRRANRELTTERVIALLQKEAPNFFALAEVVGKWVWVQFTDKQPREVTATLAELGFHWNNKRRVWQHPCGALTEGTESDPREKYPSYFPSDTRNA